jgi:hypothetical protein
LANGPMHPQHDTVKSATDTNGQRRPRTELVRSTNMLSCIVRA